MKCYIDRKMLMNFGRNCMFNKLWHKDFIKVLPNNLLLILYQDLANFALIPNVPSNVYEKKMLEFNKSHYYNYCCEVYDEITNRKWTDAEQEIIADYSGVIYVYVSDEEKQIGASITHEDLFNKQSGFMNERLFIQHYYALEEMHDLGKISDEDMNKIFDVFEKHKIFSNGGNFIW